jgi:hypothetical protein
MPPTPPPSFVAIQARSEFLESLQTGLFIVVALAVRVRLFFDVPIPFLLPWQPYECAERPFRQAQIGSRIIPFGMQ